MIRETGEEDQREKELKRAKNAAYRLLTYRPRSRKELEDKLGEKEYPDDVIRSVIEHCSGLGYINDAAFAAQWAAGRVRSRCFGRRRIEQELRSKGIERDIIREALAGAVPPEDELAAARRAAVKKLRTMRSVEPNILKRRLAGFLERKGFQSEIIWSLVSALVRTSGQLGSDHDSESS